MARYSGIRWLKLGVLQPFMPSATPSDFSASLLFLLFYSYSCFYGRFMGFYSLKACLYDSKASVNEAGLVLCSFATSSS